MASGISNWSHDDLLEFLKYHGFSFGKELGGSHSSWVNDDGKFVVEVNLTKFFYPELTMLTMIKQSGINFEKESGLL